MQKKKSRDLNNNKAALKRSAVAILYMRLWVETTNFWAIVRCTHNLNDANKLMLGIF